MNKFPKNPISYRRYFCILVLVSFYILTNSVHSNAQIPVLTAAETKQFAEKSTTLAIDLLRAVTEDKPGQNVVFSSFSIQICLGVMQLGADNQTSTDLQRLLPSHSVFHKVLIIYTRTNMLNPVSHFVYSHRRTVLSSFRNPVHQYFRSTSSVANIHLSRPITLRKPWWFEREGMFRIKTIFTVNSGINERFLFGSLMNFKNEWLNKFSEAHTQLEDFCMSAGECTQVPMMNRAGLFLYARIAKLNATALTLPYRHYDMSMLILLPDAPTDIYQLQKALTYNALKQVRSLECHRRVQVKLPKFGVTGSVRYTEALTKVIGFKSG